MGEVVHAIERAVQFTIASKVGGFLVDHVPSVGKRVLLSVGSCVLLHASPAAAAHSTMVQDLSLVVAANTILSLLVTGFQLPAVISHSCIFLLLVERIFRGVLPDTFISNVQYLFADVVSKVLLSCSVRRIFVWAGAWVLSMGLHVVSPVLSVGMSMATTGIFKAIVVDSIPVPLKLPTVIGIMCFARPLSAKMGSQLYSFALYQAADTMQECIHPPHVAFMVFLCLYWIAPTQAYAALCQIAVVGLATQIVLSSVQYIAAKADPFLALVCTLLVMRIAVAFYLYLRRYERRKTQ